MSYESYTVAELAEMASLYNDDITRELRLRPDVQAELLAQGKMCLDELSDDQIKTLDDYCFHRDWVNVDLFIGCHIIKSLTLVEMMYSGEIPFVRNAEGTFCRRAEFVAAFGEPERFAGEGNRCAQ